MHTPWVSFSGKDCSRCKHLNDRGYCEFTACIIPCTVRATIPKVKPITNADRIRAMGDTELAEWITELTDCTVYPHTRKDAPCVSIEQTCAASWLDWLKEEASE